VHRLRGEQPEHLVAVELPLRHELVRDLPDGFAVRVPTANVSLVDLTFTAGRATTVKEVNAILKDAAEGELKGILEYTEVELVSSDYIGNPASCILDSKVTNVVDGTLVKVSGWYDNEWGYASRCVDMLRFVGSRL